MLALQTHCKQKIKLIMMWQSALCEWVKISSICVYERFYLHQMYYVSCVINTLTSVDWASLLLFPRGTHCFAYFAFRLYYTASQLLQTCQPFFRTWLYTSLAKFPASHYFLFKHNFTALSLNSCRLTSSKVWLLTVTSLPHLPTFADLQKRGKKVLSLHAKGTWPFKIITFLTVLCVTIHTATATETAIYY